MYVMLKNRKLLKRLTFIIAIITLVGLVALTLLPALA